jgi:protein SERAC1
VPARTDGIYWPRDLLAHDLKEARIISWGYDVDVARPFHHSSQASIFDHSENLLTDLRNLRVDTVAAVRPIIFVCHSLGGLVVKEVYIFFLSDASSHW